MTGRAKTTVSKFGYAIEPKPDGGFVGLPSDPAMGTIEGATREEVQQKVAARVEELVRQQIPRYPFGTTVTIDRTGDAIPGLGDVPQHLDAGTPESLPTPPSTELTAKVVQFVIGAIVLLGFWHYVLQR